MLSLEINAKLQASCMRKGRSKVGVLSVFHVMLLRHPRGAKYFKHETQENGKKTLKAVGRGPWEG